MANEEIRTPAVSTDMWYNYIDSGGTGSGVAYLGYDSDFSSKTRGAFRFTNINIPKDSSISSADLHMYAQFRLGSEDIYGKIYGVDEDNTPSWGSQPFGRTKTTASNTHNTSISQGGYFTIGVGSIIEEIVSRSGWSSGNAIGFIIEDNGTTQASGNELFYDNFGGVDTFLHFRVDAEPNFKPTPVSVSAPAIPGTDDFGIKISKPGQSVFTSTEASEYFSTRKKQFKVFSEAYYQSVAADITAGFKTIPHNLGYIPFASVYVKSTVFGGSWKKLPISWQFEDHPTYYIDDTNLYLHSAVAGEEFYYYIFNDQLAT